MRGMGNIRLAGMLLLGLLLGMLGAGCAAREKATPPKRPIEDLPVKVIEPPLSPCCADPKDRFPFERVGYWLNDNLLIFDVARDVPDAELKKLRRLMLLNVSTGQATTLLEEGFTNLGCWNQERQIVRLDETIRVDSPGKFYKLTQDGELIEPAEQPDLHSGSCLPSNYAEQVSGLKGFGNGYGRIYFHESVGFLTGLSRERFLSGKGTPLGAKAIWMRPGAPPVQMDFYIEEVDNPRLPYIAFKDKYLLNEFDSQSSGSTRRGTRSKESWGDRTYEFTPYRLMSRDGRIEEIPYPTILKEFDVRYFGRVRPVRDGLLIDATENRHGERGIFLLQGERLFRINPMGWDWGAWKMHGWSFSPDGCKVAFHRYTRWKPGFPKFLTILDLCQGGNHGQH